MKKFYLDTNIWLDYFQNRSDGLKPLGEFAFQFLKKAIESNSIIYYSDLVLDELIKIIGEEKTNEGLEQYKTILIFVCINSLDFFEANKIHNLTRLHSADALHAAISKRLGATLISRDKHFFEIDSIDVCLPEDVLEH